MTEQAQKSYRFEPIISEALYERALSYIAAQSLELAEATIQQSLPRDTLTIFAQSEQEYGVVEALIKQRGRVSPLSHGTTLYVETEAVIHGQRILLLGVRKPDETRPERGYGDYPVTDLKTIQAQISDNPYAHTLRSGNGTELVELRHPDFDVRGYIVQAERGVLEHE